MEVVREAPKDFISNMPDNVVTNILDPLPLQDAVSTSILARNWRFKWTMLSQLILDEYFFRHIRRTEGLNNRVRIISRLLLQLRGAITKVVLEVIRLKDVEQEDISHWILFLSSKGIKDFTLDYFDEKTPLKVSTHLFSCLELKHLTLRNCCFRPPPTFHGFPNLLSLDLNSQFKEPSDFGEIITRCPLLEILKVEYFFSSCEVNLVEIAKLENLKILYLSFCDLNTRTTTSSSSIFKLLGSLPKLQELGLNFMGCELTEGGANNRFSPIFPSVTALKLSSICLEDNMKLSCAFKLIRSFPNLQTLEITRSNWDAPISPQVDCDTTGMLQLRSVMFEYEKCSENEVCLIKYILACSPFLKQMVIHPPSSNCFLTLDEKLTFAMKLLKLHRASSVAEINFLKF